MEKVSQIEKMIISTNELFHAIQVVGNEAYREGILVFDGRQAQFACIGIWADDSTVADGVNGGESASGVFDTLIGIETIGEQEEGEIICPFSMRSYMSAKVIINPIDFVHVGNIDQSAML